MRQVADKTVLFCSAPHPEKAASLDEMEAEMNALYKVLADANNKEVNVARWKKNINDLVYAVKRYPDRFWGWVLGH